MQIRTTYKGTTEDGIKGIWCGFKPDNITVTEEIQILYPDENKQLRNKITGELTSCVTLNGTTNQDDYEEVEIEDIKEK